MPRKSNSQTSEHFERIADLRVAVRRFEAATDKITATHRLTPRQYDLLALLHAPSRSVGLASTLADQLSISRNAMTELVSRAETAGLVYRGGDSNDARRKPIKPTSEGSRRFRAALAALGPERRQLLLLLEAAAEEAEQLTHPAAGPGEDS